MTKIFTSQFFFLKKHLHIKFQKVPLHYLFSLQGINIFVKLDESGFGERSSFDMGVSSLSSLEGIIYYAHGETPLQESPLIEMRLTRERLSLVFNGSIT